MLSCNLAGFLTGVNICQVQIVLEDHREDNCTLPARASAHTENVHFLKPDEGHFFLKAINTAIRKHTVQYIHSQSRVCMDLLLRPNAILCNYQYTIHMPPLV